MPVVTVLEVGTEDWGVDGLPAAEHRLAAAGSPS
jgi:hypothetical protein